MTVPNDPPGTPAKSTSRDGGTHTKSTLFLRRLPAHTTASHLETFFSEWGPVRSAFTVPSKTKEAKGTLVGFVHFALAEDAKRAVEAVQAGITFEGVTVTGELALRKGMSKTATKEEKPLQKTSKRARLSAEEEKSPVAKKAKSTTVDEKESMRSACLLATFTTSEAPKASFDRKQLYKRVRKVGEVKEVDYPLDGDVSKARLLFSSVAEAQKALAKLQGHIFKGHHISLQADPRAASKAHRLIVRNLPFSIKESTMLTAFGAHGRVVELAIPMKNIRECRGFAFVQMSSREEAEKVMEAFNGKELAGRMVVLDWAVNKTTFERLQSKEEETETGAEAKVETGAEAKVETGAEATVETDTAAEAESEEEHIDVEDDGGDKGPETAKRIGVKVESDVEEEEEEEEDGEEEIDVEGDSSSDVESPSKSQSKSKSKSKSKSQSTPKSPAKSDAVSDAESSVDAEPDSQDKSAHTTVFIRNVSFGTEESDLLEALSRFGPVEYCKIVRDAATGTPKGTAFAKFRRGQDAASACAASLKVSQLQLEAQQDAVAEAVPSQPSALEKSLHSVESKLADLARKRTGKDFQSLIDVAVLSNEHPSAAEHRPQGIVVDGRALNLVPAVDRKEAAKLKREGGAFLNSGPQDRRNLYLLQETSVKPKTQLAKKFWPAVDIGHRETILKDRRRELKNNPNVFVSRTRLSLRYLPVAVTEADVKRVLRTALQRALALQPDEEGYPLVDDKLLRNLPSLHASPLTQVKIVTEAGRQRSKGYGFAEFRLHEHALLALRYLTNYAPGLWRELLADKFAGRKARHTEGGAFRAKAPVVEFATEKAAVVTKRIERLRQQQKPHSDN